MSQHTKSPGSSSSSTLIVPPLPSNTKKDPDAEVARGSYPGWVSPNQAKRMSGKGFIEPHRNNLPRRKRRVVTAPVDGAVPVCKIGKTLSHELPTSEAGPHPTNLKNRLLQDGTPGRTPTPITLPTSTSSSSSANTNITEPPSSLRASPIPSVHLHKSPAPSEASTALFSNPTFQIPNRPFFHSDDALATTRYLPLTPTKGHLQPTSVTVPRRHREQRQQTRNSNNALGEVGGRLIKEARADIDTNLVTDLESQDMPSICFQELAKSVTLGFLADEDNHVQIKIYDNSPSSSTSSSSSPRSPSSSPSSGLQLQLPLPTNLSPFPYTDGTTSLTDSQIQQACAFIDAHICIQDPVSVLILTPRQRPEEAMSIGVSYLAGMEEMNEHVGGREISEDHDEDDDVDYTYSTVHRLLMAFHDDPGSLLPNHGMTPEVNPSESEHGLVSSLGGCGFGTPGWRGLRPEWRGVLSFDGMRRLDGVWRRN